MNKALDLLREIRPSIPKEVLELWCKDRDAFLASHPAVEQAGGDERAAFELFVRKHCGMPAHIAVNWDAKFTNDAWEGWKARAALAQPSQSQYEASFEEWLANELEGEDGQPVPAAVCDIALARRAFNHWPKLEHPAKVGGVRFSAGVSSRLVVEAAQRLYEFESTPEKEAERIERLQAFREQLDPLNLAPHAEAFNEAPDEALRPEQAEAERPEAAEVAFVLRNIGAMDAEDIDGDNVDLRFEDAEGRDTGCDVSIVEYAEKAADLFEQHDRIVGALRAERDGAIKLLGQSVWQKIQLLTQERDAALARVAELETKLAELEKQEPAGWLAYHFGGKRQGTVYGGPCDTKEEIERYIQQVERSDDSITLQGKPFYAAPAAQAQHSDQSELRRIAVALTNPLLNGQEASDLMVRYEALTMPDHIIALIDSQAQYIAPDELRAICMLVAEAGIKYGRGRDRAVASDECREVVDSVLPLEPSPSNSEQHCEPEIMAVAEGVLTFMRSEKEGSHCTCCNGPHIFCRYFEGMSDFDDITRKARFRNDLEGRTFRLVLELLPAALSGKEGV
ncbi:hypothetical protein I5Q67_13985 [Pseudomonas aeruginosa]|nr:hypothetical protein [Pseudomonas aeruginosa]